MAVLWRVGTWLGLTLAAALATAQPAPTDAAKPAAGAEIKPDGGDAAYSKAAMQALSVARFHYKRGEFLQAAALLHNAYRIQPKVEFLFNAARAEHRAMKLNIAKRHFQHCLKLKDVPEKVSRRATMYIKEIETMQAALAKARKEAGARLPPKPAPPVIVKKPAPPPSPAWQKPAGWAGVGLGAVLLGAGTWVWISYAADQQALNEKTDIKDDAGQVVGIDWQRYEAGQEVLNSRALLRTGLMAGGVVAAAGGAWALLNWRGKAKKAAWRIGPGAGRSVVAALRF